MSLLKFALSVLFTRGDQANSVFFLSREITYLYDVIIPQGLVPLVRIREGGKQLELSCKTSYSVGFYCKYRLHSRLNMMNHCSKYLWLLAENSLGYSLKKVVTWPFDRYRMCSRPHLPCVCVFVFWDGNAHLFYLAAFLSLTPFRVRWYCR